jgi:hypothetical protein
MVDVADVTEGQMELLRKEGMTDSQVYDQQLTVAEKSNQYLATMDASMRVIVKNMGGNDRDILRTSLSQQLGEEMPKISDDQLKRLSSGDAKEMKTVFEEIKSNMVDKDGGIKLLDNLKEALGLVGIKKANDFILRPGEPMTRLNEDDIVLGGTNLLGETDNITNRVNNMSTTMNQSTTMGGGKGLVELSGTLKIEGSGQSADVDVRKLLSRLSSGDLQNLSMMLEKASS